MPVYKLISYICLFLKYDKNIDYINYNLIQYRLKKELLKYRNIFAITRFIDNLYENIINNKICLKCYCKEYEKCKNNCNCHISNNTKIYVKNISNYKKSFLKNNDNNKNKKEKNIINKGKNKIYLKNINEENNKTDEYGDGEVLTLSNLTGDNLINQIYIKNAFTYFNK